MGLIRRAKVGIAKRLAFSGAERRAFDFHNGMISDININPLSFKQGVIRGIKADKNLSAASKKALVKRATGIHVARR